MTAPQHYDTPQHYEAAFPGDPHMVAQARRWTRAALAGAGVPDELVCDALTCVSELATNASKHTASGEPGGKYRVVVEVAGGRVHVEVVDQGGPGTPDVLLGGGESGRGLWICAALGVVKYAVVPSGGRRVCVDLPHSADGTHDAARDGGEQR
ncbi:ATP-binding protein [Actinomadura rudentiformis]|uniref:ATP-binding protein n=1 Tax=Actinomadura rudentiformis TaxID=359158 RepID=A0A6H9YH38_9ACTN|nr:ATP-binding protein [Actinomadura rudentiformis]KAB2341519.1 ATP-binding protein [Actinomadura rudentiformis]